MAIDINQSLCQIRDDLSPLKIKVELEVEDHIYFIKFTHCLALTNGNYWQEFWGMEFDQFVKLWMQRYFKTINLDSATTNSAKFKLGSLLDFLKNSHNEL